MSPASPSAPASGGDTGTLARGASTLLAGRVAGRATGFLVQFLVARTLGRAAFGVFSMGWRVVLILGILATLGLDQGVIRWGTRFWPHDRAGLRGLFRRSVGIALAVGLGLAAALVASSRWLALEVFESPALEAVLLGLAPGLVLMAGLRVVAACTRASQTMRASVVAEDLSQPIVQVIGVAIALALGLGLAGVVAATVLSQALALVVGVALLGRLVPGWLGGRERRSVPVGELVAFSLPTALAGVLSLFALWIDVLLVGAFLSDEATGVYNAAALVSLLFALVLNSFNGIFAPMIADLHHRRETDRLDRLFKVTTKWGLYLCLPVFSVVAVAPAELLALLGSGYEEGVMPMLILCAGQLFNLSTGAVGFLLIMSGRQNVWLAASATALAGNVALNVFLIPRYGLVGAAVATTVSVGILFGSGLVVARRSLGLWPWDRRYVKGLAAAVGAAAAAWGVVAVGWVPAPFDAIAALAASGLVFWALLALLGFDAEDRELARRVLGALRGRR